MYNALVNPETFTIDHVVEYNAAYLQELQDRTNGLFELYHNHFNLIFSSTAQV
jgi:hypothetical protein